MAQWRKLQLLSVSAMCQRRYYMVLNNIRSGNLILYVYDFLTNLKALEFIGYLNRVLKRKEFVDSYCV